MTYAQQIEKELIKFLEIDDKIINGRIPPHLQEVAKRFISYKIKSDKIKTLSQEEKDRLTISKTLNKELKEKIESPIEEFMLLALTRRQLDKHCRMQFQIGTKRVDFAFPIARLVVECDGKEYHFTDGELMEKDLRRDMYLAKKGWIVKHFDGLSIRRNVDVCINEINEFIKPFIK